MSTNRRRPEPEIDPAGIQFVPDHTAEAAPPGALTEALARLLIALAKQRRESDQAAVEPETGRESGR